jgi:hypothetical protein
VIRLDTSGYVPLMHEILTEKHESVRWSRNVINTVLPSTAPLLHRRCIHTGSRSLRKRSDVVARPQLMDIIVGRDWGARREAWIVGVRARCDVGRECIVFRRYEGTSARSDWLLHVLDRDVKVCQDRVHAIVYVEFKKREAYGEIWKIFSYHRR